MNSMPGTETAKTHCVRHRREHVNFSTQYNFAVADLAACQPAIGAARLEALVIDWIRRHALEYDDELAAIVGDARANPRRGAGPA
jgi:hemerythrin